MIIIRDDMDLLAMPFKRKFSVSIDVSIIYFALKKVYFSDNVTIFVQNIFVVNNSSRHNKTGLNILSLFLNLWQSWKKMAGILFEDIFDVKDIDPDGKKFDRGM